MAATIFTPLVLFLTSIIIGNILGTHFSYHPDGQSEPCILMDTTFAIRINAVRDGFIIASDIFRSNDKKVDITGECDATTALLNLGFLGNMMWSFKFETEDEIVKMNRLIQFVPTDMFASYVTNISDFVTFKNPNTISSPIKKSYLCKTKTRTKYDPLKPVPGETTFSVEIEIVYLKFQAFGVKHGHYRPSVLCIDDITNATTRKTHPTTSSKTSSTTVSTSSATTTTSTEVTPTKIPDNTYFVINKNNASVCIVLSARIDVNIRYEYNTTDGKTGSRFVSFPIPSNATWYGNCILQGGSQNLVIEFFNSSWSIEFIFKERENSYLMRPNLINDVQEDLDYDIHNINLVYVIDHDKFPDSVLPVNKKIRVNSTGQDKYYPHKSLEKDYYSCSAENNMKLNSNAHLTTFDLKFKAFNEDDNTEFKGPASKCVTDNNDVSEEAILIICLVVGGLVLVTVCIGLITVCRKRRRKNYTAIKG